MLTRAELKEKAKQQLKNRWGDIIAATLIFSLLTNLPASLGNFNQENGSLGLVYFLALLVITGPLTYGLVKYFINLVNKGNSKFTWETFIVGFKGDLFLKTVKLYLLMSLKIFLWTLLLIIPGIVMAYAYSMAFYIFHDEPNLSTDEILKKSKAMMEGHKFELFVLQLSFLGWSLLALLTCGIGFLWLAPYMNTVFINYYQELKKNYGSKTKVVAKKS